MLFFEPTVLNSEHCTARFTANDGDIRLGICDLLLHNNLADITAVSLKTDDLSIGEGLLRAAYNYAANKGAYWGVCSAENAGEITARLRFETEDGMPQGDIPTLLTGFCDRHSAQNGGQL